MGRVNGEAVVDLYIEIEKVQQRVLVNYKPDRERSLVMTKLDEASLWLQKCVRQEPASPEQLAVEAAE